MDGCLLRWRMTGVPWRQWRWHVARDKACQLILCIQYRVDGSAIELAIVQCENAFKQGVVVVCQKPGVGCSTAAVGAFHRFLRIVELRERRRTISRALEKVRDVHGTGEFDEMFRISESRTDRGQAGMEPERTSAHGCGGQRQQHFARVVGFAAFV